MIARLLLIATFILSIVRSANAEQGRLTNTEKQNIFTATQEQSGILLKHDQELLKIYFVKADIVRVQYVPAGELRDNQTDVCIPRTEVSIPFQFSQNAVSFFLLSAKLKVAINKLTGAISYFTVDGTPLFKENTAHPRLTEKIDIEKIGFDNNKRKVEKTANGDVVMADVASKKIVGSAWKAKTQFEWVKGEALYGLGSHQEDYMNLRGTMQYLYQHNLKKSVPVLMSSVGYGLLFDVGSTMIFHDDSAGSFMEMNAVNEVDYYFMYGPEFDQIIGHYRDLTGKVQIMPKYIFGYVQSKERYASPHDIDSVLTRFRTSGIPLDVIVQDWNYWKPGLWGHKKFDEDFYPDPASMINNVHQKNAHYMLSIWPNVAANEETEMGEKGFVLGRRIYDAFNPAARKTYWNQYVNKNLFSFGVDAWWCDSSEPTGSDWDIKANAIANNPKARYEINSKALNDLLGPLRANLFSLHHAEGIYENQRLTTVQKRVVNLTRSGFAGIQRYGTFIWNGDTKATWADFAQWIPSGLNYMVTGNPYWTIDAGAFFVKKKSQWFWAGEFEKGTSDPGYREFYVRNLQFSGWLPMLRSHGTDYAREPWQFGKPGEPFYESILKQINLRYRLLPYTYSVAAMVADENYTMTRALIFDFRKDDKVYDIKDQFMFGPSFMACPVIKPMYFDPDGKALENVAKTRSVYLPKTPVGLIFGRVRLIRAETR
jgi:alpha-D-xyloside xylohydrolase